MSSRDELRKLKLKKRVLSKLRKVIAEWSSPTEPRTAYAQKATKYTLLEGSLLRKLSKLRGAKDRCPSGILLNVPLAIPLRVLTWLSLPRLYEIHDMEVDNYYYFVCLDDVGRATQLSTAGILSKMWLKGVAPKHQLENMIAAFTLVLARLAKTNRYVRFSKRLHLATEIEKAVWSVLSKWAEEEGGGVAEK